MRATEAAAGKGSRPAPLHLNTTPFNSRLLCNQASLLVPGLYCAQWAHAPHKHIAQHHINLNISHSGNLSHSAILDSNRCVGSSFSCRFELLHCRKRHKSYAATKASDPDPLLLTAITDRCC